MVPRFKVAATLAALAISTASSQSTVQEQRSRIESVLFVPNPLPLMTRPLGADARENAALKVITFERVVSLQADGEFAPGFAAPATRMGCRAGPVESLRCSAVT
jgi:hypothetical protein